MCRKKKESHTRSDRSRSMMNFTPFNNTKSIMKALKTFQWIILVLVLAVAVVSCKDNDSLTTPEAAPAPTMGSQVDEYLTEAGLQSNSLSLVYETPIGPYTFKVYTETPIDVETLLEGIDGNDTSETIQSKINAKRTTLYPEEEIIVDVSGVAQQKEETPANVNAYLHIVRRVYWWNNSNRYNYHWISTMSCNSVALFFRVLSGSYRLYENSNGAWRYISTKYAGTTTAAAISGYDNVKGFMGVGRSRSNKADVVMYFFR